MRLALFQQFPVTGPVELRPGIGFARGRDISMADDVSDWIFSLQHACEFGKHPVLRVAEHLIVRALELDADRIIVATGASPPVRLATNWMSSPSRLIRKWAETLSAAIPR